jgi:hypothetical protein
VVPSPEGTWVEALSILAGPWPLSEADDGLEPATPTLAIAWRMSHVSPSVSPVSLSCMFLALLSHASHQIAGVDPISLVISLE